MEPKRRLPLLQEPGAPAGDDAEEVARAPWQWVAFGALAIVVVWVPLAWLSVLAAARVGSGTPDAAANAPDAAVVVQRTLVLAAGLALAAFAGGALVGRWGHAGAGVRQAALAGLVAALAATLLAWTTLGVSLGSLATLVVAVPFAALGGRIGRRRRP
jgi:hypothetical protein